MLSFPVPYQTFDDRMSVPVDIEWKIIPSPTDLTGVDLVDTPNPVLMLCSVCDDDGNACSFGNTCSADGTCSCTDGSSGALCQLPPTGDGHCDIRFNTPEFDYDGGDCCAATCVGDRCGLTTVGNLTDIRIGFPYCQDPQVLGSCANSSAPCYIPSSKPIEPLSTDGRMTSALTTNGRVMAVGEPDIGTVRVFDLVGSDWVQRGRTLQGTPANYFGSRISVASPPPDVVGGKGRPLPVVVAVAEGYGGLIRVFAWEAGAGDWQEQASSKHESSDETWFYDPAVQLDVGLLYVSILGFDSEPTLRLLVNNEFDDTTEHIMFEVGTESKLNGGMPPFSDSSDMALSADGLSYVASVDDGTGRFVLERTNFIFDLTDAANGDVYSLELPTSGPVSLDTFLSDEWTWLYFADASSPIEFNLETFLRTHTGSVFVLERDTGDSVIQYRIVYLPDEGDPVTYDLYYGTGDIDRAATSSDGTAVMLVQSDGTVDRVVALNPDRSAWVEIALGYDLPSDEIDDLFGPSLSSRGEDIAISTVGSIQVLSPHKPVCRENEVTLRLAIHQGVNVVFLSWGVYMGGREDNNNNMLASCDYCYALQSALYASTATSEDICVSQEDVQDLRLSFRESESGIPAKDIMVGFAAYLIDGMNVTLLATDDFKALESGKEYDLGRQI